MLVNVEEEFSVFKKALSSFLLLALSHNAASQFCCFFFVLFLHKAYVLGQLVEKTEPIYCSLNLLSV